MHTAFVALLFWLGFCLLAVAGYLARQERVNYRRSREYLGTGTRRDGGSDKLSASTTTKEHGTPTRATATTAGCSSYSRRGDLLAAMGGLTLVPRANSFTVRGVSTSATGARGASGEPPESAA